MHNACLKKDKVPEDWKVCVIIVYKGKGEKSICSNYRGISLSSVAVMVAPNYFFLSLLAELNFFYSTIHARVLKVKF